MPSASVVALGITIGPAGVEGGAHLRQVRRLDADHAHGRLERLHHQRHSAEPAAAADGSDQHVDVRDLLEDLQRGGALPGDDRVIVEGVDEDVAPSLPAGAAPRRTRRRSWCRRGRSRAPNRRVACTLLKDAVSGMTIVAWMPRRWALMATPCAWLPALAATTPRLRSSGVSSANLFAAPRSLNEPVRCRFSSLKCTRAPQISLNGSESGHGVTATMPRMRSRAARTSCRVTIGRAGWTPAASRSSLSCGMKSHAAPVVEMAATTRFDDWGSGNGIQGGQQGGRSAGSGRRDGRRSADDRDLRARHPQAAGGPGPAAVQGVGGREGARPLLGRPAAGDPGPGVRGSGGRSAGARRSVRGRSRMPPDRDATGVGGVRRRRDRRDPRAGGHLPLSRCEAPDGRLGARRRALRWGGRRLPGTARRAAGSSRRAAGHGPDRVGAGGAERDARQGVPEHPRASRAGIDSGRLPRLGPLAQVPGAGVGRRAQAGRGPGSAHRDEDPGNKARTLRASCRCAPR